MGESSYTPPKPTVKFPKHVIADNSDDLVAAIDVGTSSTRLIVFNANGDMLGSAQAEFEQLFPNPAEGWHEHNPFDISSQTFSCIEALADSAPSLFIEGKIKGIGITNMRETTIVWNAKTGLPYYNAIVWDDLRTANIASKMASDAPDGLGIDRFRDITGLPLSTYFSATKMRWLLENVPELLQDLSKESNERDNVRFGTVDTWLIYQLTGGKDDATYVTDVTNASRTLLMDLRTSDWDETLINAFFGDIVSFPTTTALPEIKSSSEVFCTCRPNHSSALHGVPISGILGDQQAALFGQAAVHPGEAKCTYGTGLFLMMNTGTACVPSTNGLLTTPAYQLGPDAEVVYALEGSVSHAGSVIQWLRDKLCIIESAVESAELAESVPDNEGLYFVPAFAGLFAPYWRSDARGCIVGMTAGHHKGHICRAALEASAFQARALLDAMNKDASSGIGLTTLKVDGGMTMNELLMDFQSNIHGTKVVRPKVAETTAMGAAFAAGLATGVWEDTEAITKMWAIDKTWTPSMPKEIVEKYWKGWNKAVTKSLDWAE